MLILAAALVCVAIHLFTIALAGSLIGVRLQLIAFGMGPQVLKVGVLRLGLWPFGGRVQFLDTRAEQVPADKMALAFDARSTTEQLIIVLSGCAMLLLVADAVASESAMLPAFMNAPSQFLAGAMSPLSEAQAMIRGGIETARSLSFLALVGIIATKLAALNLLPFPHLNGGAAIGALARGLGVHVWWPLAATHILNLLFTALFLSWAYALVLYLLGY